VNIRNMEKELTKQDILDLFAQQALKAEHQREQDRKDFDRRMKELSRKIGDLSHTWGRFAEEQVKPHAINLFQRWGMNIHEYAEHTTFKLAEKAYVEVDMLLFNEDTVVILEIKNTLRQRDVEKHLERMQKLSEHHSSILKNKSLYGAIAGNRITPEVENFAIQEGFFVIKPMSENVGISNELDFEPKIWKVY